MFFLNPLQFQFIIFVPIFMCENHGDMPILEMTLLDDDLYQDRHSPSGHRPKFD